MKTIQKPKRMWQKKKDYNKKKLIRKIQRRNKTSFDGGKDESYSDLKTNRPIIIGPGLLSMFTPKPKGYKEGKDYFDTGSDVKVDRNGTPITKESLVMYGTPEQIADPNQLWEKPEEKDGVVVTPHGYYPNMQSYIAATHGSAYDPAFIPKSLMRDLYYLYGSKLSGGGFIPLGGKYTGSHYFKMPGEGFFESNPIGGSNAANDDFVKEYFYNNSNLKASDYTNDGQKIIDYKFLPLPDNDDTLRISPSQMNIIHNQKLNEPYYFDNWSYDTYPPQKEIQDLMDSDRYRGRKIFDYGNANYRIKKNGDNYSLMFDDLFDILPIVEQTAVTYPFRVRHTVPITDKGFPADSILFDKVILGHNSGKDIHIKKANRGKFTEAANEHNMGVQEFARQVLSAPKGKYSPTLRKRANFARNFAH